MSASSPCSPVSIKQCHQPILIPRIRNNFQSRRKLLSFGVNLSKRFSIRCNVFGETESAGLFDVSNAIKDDIFVGFFREAWPYFLAHRGSTFVVLISAEIVDSSPHLDPLLMARS